MDQWRYNADDSRFVGFFDHAGFAVVEQVLGAAEVDRLISAVTRAIGPDGYAKRNLLASIPEVAALGRSPSLKALVEPVLGPSVFPVKGTLFDKTPGANWKVAWHQDSMICVRERIETPGFGPWSVKAGIVHVQPPGEVLAGMMTVRIHLDDCGADNGPLRVIPGSHQSGLLSAEAIDGWREAHPAVICTVPSGGAVLMRPLTLHASSAATVPGHRRVIHLEYAASPLSNGLHWANC